MQVMKKCKSWKNASDEKNASDKKLQVIKKKCKCWKNGVKMCKKVISFKLQGDFSQLFDKKKTYFSEKTINFDFKSINV